VFTIYLRSRCLLGPINSLVRHYEQCLQRRKSIISNTTGCFFDDVDFFVSIQPPVPVISVTFKGALLYSPIIIVLPRSTEPLWPLFMPAGCVWWKTVQYIRYCELGQRCCWWLIPLDLVYSVINPHTAHSCRSTTMIPEEVFDVAHFDVTHLVSLFDVNDYR